MRALLTTAALLLTLSASAQIPNTLLHSIPAPPVGVEGYAYLGYSVAVEGGYTVVGAPLDGTGGTGGVLKVFDSTTGALLLVITNPGQSAFGRAVAISGTRVVSGKYVFDLSSATPTVPVVTLNNPGAADDDFGFSLAISGMRVVVGASWDDTGADGAGIAYVYDLGSSTPSVPAITLNNPGPAASDNFGNSVAIFGTKVVVGAYNDDNGATDAGSAYVYELSSGTPSVPVATLNNPSPAESGRFGKSVAVSGTRVVVGADGDDTGADSAGSVYVYDLTSGTAAIPVTILNNPSPAAGDSYGTSVAISGTRVVVGAQWDDTGADGAGSAYVYDLGSGTPTLPVVTLSNPEPMPSDLFGNSVAIYGTQVVVGAFGDDRGAGNAGSAYVYELNSATPSTPMAILNNPSAAAGDLFGSSVAVSGTRVVVGVPQDDTGADGAGSAYVYDLASSTPSVPVATLNNPSPAANEFFGNSVAISGMKVVVGTPRDSTGASSAGSAYVYDLASGTPGVPVITLNNPIPAASDLFGGSVAISGTRVVIGAYQDDTGASNAGSVYVYDLSGGVPTVPIATLTNPSPASNDWFGYSVAISGTHVAVGAHRDDTGASNAGSAYIYDLSSSTPSVPMAILNKPGPALNDTFGWSVAVSGTHVVVGSTGDDTGAVDAGSAYVYDLSSDTPNLPAATLNNPSPAESDWFGRSVAISGAQVVVGAIQDSTGAGYAGSAYVYHLGSGTPSVPAATLNNPYPADSDYFGTSVAIDGATVAIGAPNDDTVMLDKGSVYVFGPAADADSDGLLDSWELTYWPTTTGHGPGDDEDKDGIVNLLELAFGLNPTQGNGSPLPPPVNEGGYLTLTITKQPGVTYQVQSAGTLLPLMPDSFSTASTTVLLDNATTLKVRDNVLMSTPGGRFMRAQVTAAP